MGKLDIIKGFEQKKILLVGDTILDIYSYGRKVCKSSDSDAVEVEEDKVSISFGGASLVASNILELGGKIIFFSVIGDDEAAKHYDSFNHPNLVKYFFVDGDRPTTVKKRYWTDDKKVLQVNQVNNKGVSKEFEQKILSELKPYFDGINLIVILDAQHGLMTESLIASLIDLAQRYQKPMYVDSQVSHRGSNHHLYKMADCIFFNETEAKTALPNFDINNLETSLKLIKEKLALNNVVVKLGRQGSVALFNGRFIKGLPYPVKTVDLCGAGDAFLAAFSLTAREAPEESLTIANTWAALSTTIRGTLPPKKQDLIKIYAQNAKN